MNTAAAACDKRLRYDFKLIYVVIMTMIIHVVLTSFDDDPVIFLPLAQFIDYASFVTCSELMRLHVD